MSYVDAGYAIALSTLACYGLALVVRRRHLARAAGRVAPAGGPAAPAGAGGPAPPLGPAPPTGAGGACAPAASGAGAPDTPRRGS